MKTEDIIKRLDGLKLSSQKVELAVLQDIEKILDKANSQRKQLDTRLRKLAGEYNELQTPYNIAFQKANTAENQAKDLGAFDAAKLFFNRGSEAKDFSKEVGKKGQKLKAIS